MRFLSIMKRRVLPILAIALTSISLATSACSPPPVEIQQAPIQAGPPEDQTVVDAEQYKAEQERRRLLEEQEGAQ